MARGRLVSKSLGSSRKFHDLLRAGGKLGEFCQVLFPLIVANTDDFGRMPGDAFTVKNVVLPSSRRPEQDFDTALTVMHDVGLLVRYAHDGSIYVEITNFREHQPGLHQRGESRFPEPPQNAREMPAAAGNVVLREGKVREEKVSEGKGTEGAVAGARKADTLFDAFWASYPKKRSKEDAQRAWDKRRPNDELLTVMLRALECQKQSPDWQKESGRYIPLPATWLRDARWTDVVEVDIVNGGLMISDQTRSNLAARESALSKLKAGGVA